MIANGNGFDVFGDRGELLAIEFDSLHLEPGSLDLVAGFEHRDFE